MLFKNITRELQRVLQLAEILALCLKIIGNNSFLANTVSGTSVTSKKYVEVCIHS